MRARSDARSLRWAAALLAVVGAEACIDSMAVPAEEGQGRQVAVFLAPVLASAPAFASAADAPITQARLTARDASTGVVYGSATIDLDAGADSWSLPLSLELPEGSRATVIIEIQLLAIVDGVAVVQWSGETQGVSIHAGIQETIREVPVYRGPPDNLNVKGVDLTTPASVDQGAVFSVSAKVVGGGSKVTVFFSSLDPSVATVDAAGNVVALTGGTVRIVASAGPKADTGVVVVRSAPPARRRLDPALDDAMSRVLPNLRADAASATTLRAQLAAIQSALQAGMADPARAALNDARRTLGGYAGGSDGPDLSIIGLILDHVERLIPSL